MKTFLKFMMVGSLLTSNLMTIFPSNINKIEDGINKIIFSVDWVADGYESYVFDVETGDVIRKLPEFHKLFPKDWKAPLDENTGEDESSEDKPFIRLEENNRK